MRLPNLRKALYVDAFWKNQNGQKRFSETLPELPTYNNEPFDPFELVHIGDVEMTRMEHAKRLGGPDKWTFHVVVKFPASEVCEAQGDDAHKLWKAWKAVVYGPQ